MKRRLLTVLAALLFVCLAAVPASALTVPPVPTGTWVYDGAGVLSGTTETQIDNHLAILKEETGAEIAVVTVEFANGDMEDLAYAIINEWGVGSATLNNGVVILFSTGDDDYYVTMGYGIEDVLDAGTLRVILDEYTEPKFAVQDYDGAMADTFVAIYNELASYYGINAIASLNSMPTPSGTSYNEGDPYVPYDSYTPSRSDSSSYLFLLLIRIAFWILVIRFFLWMPYVGTVRYWGWWLFRPRVWALRHPGWTRPVSTPRPSSGHSYTTYHGIHGSGSSHYSSGHSSYHSSGSHHSSGSFHSSGGSWSSHSSGHSSHGGFSGGGGHGGGAGRGR